MLVAVAAVTIKVAGPTTITVTYVSGTVDLGIGTVGPNGGQFNGGGYQNPLQEAQGISGAVVYDGGALIGVFVPKNRVEDPRGFQAIDGTKNLTPVGIQPYFLHFIGEHRTFTVQQAGTLFLGINDGVVTDNSGGFTVTVTSE